jgi:hypothetical protein
MIEVKQHRQIVLMIIVMLYTVGKSQYDIDKNVSSFFIAINTFLCNHTRNEYFAYLKFIDSEVNFACSFYNNYKFSVAQKIWCTPLPRNPLIFLRLSDWPQAASSIVFLSLIFTELFLIKKLH